MGQPRSRTQEVGGPQPGRIVLRSADLPGLYQTADKAANDTQRALLQINKASAGLLIAAAAVTLFSTGGTWLALTSAALFLLSLGTIIYEKATGLQRRWYQARALAESVKTATW